MAPYTVAIEFDNQSSRQLHTVGTSTLRNLDGRTSVTELGMEEGLWPKTSGVAHISKSGGTDGLFSAMTWGVTPASYPMSQPLFSVVCRMPASAGGSVSIGLASVKGMSDTQFRESSWMNYCYDYPDGPGYNDVQVLEGLRIELQKKTIDYPDSAVRVTITS